MSHTQGTLAPSGCRQSYHATTLTASRGAQAQRWTGLAGESSFCASCALRVCRNGRGPCPRERVLLPRRASQERRSCLERARAALAQCGRAAAAPRESPGGTAPEQASPRSDGTQRRHAHTDLARHTQKRQRERRAGRAARKSNARAMEACDCMPNLGVFRRMALA